MIVQAADGTTYEAGRRYSATVTGNNTLDLEDAALEEARVLFGEGPVLRVASFYAYRSHDTTKPGRYEARIIVHEVVRELS
jgi:hypothetical protein